jgi:hypothetical protein
VDASYHGRDQRNFACLKAKGKKIQRRGTPVNDRVCPVQKPRSRRRKSRRAASKDVRIAGVGDRGWWAVRAGRSIRALSIRSKRYDHTYLHLFGAGCYQGYNSFMRVIPPDRGTYRPKRTAHDAVDRVARAIVQQKTRIIDIDLRSYFDNVRHDRLLAKVARRVDDVDVMHLLKIMLKANGKQGVPQGGVISPLLSNLYLTEVDRMLERAKETTRFGEYTYIEYARFADDLVILIDAHPRHDWLMGAVEKRLREELAVTSGLNLT